MPLRYYEGVEGAGKTAMMTRDLYLHYLAGGKVLSFPGYELLGKGPDDILSDVLLPEQWVNLPDSLKRKKVAIAIDEVTNYFNNHVWYNKMCDMMAALMAERRKFAIAILMTGPIFARLPPNIRELVHELIHCRDYHIFNRTIPRGEKCIYFKENMRGFLSRHRYSRRKIFYTKPWWPHYDTFFSVDFVHQFTKVKIKGREIMIGSDGKVISSDEAYQVPDLDEKEVAKRINQLKVRNSAPDPRLPILQNIVKKLNGSGIAASFVYDMLDVKKFADKREVGIMMKQLGYKYQPWNHEYGPI